MPHPKDRKVQSKRRILDSAIELFSRNGFEKVSIGEIMSKAKMTHGAFYAHFDSKEALFKASFLETMKRSRSARLVKGPLSLEHLTNLVTHYWNLRELAQSDNPGPEVILFNEIGSENTKVKQLFEESYNNLKKILETRLVALGKLKQISLNVDREIAAEKARVILSLLIGAVVVAKSMSHKDEQQKILESAQQQILCLLGVTEPCGVDS